MKTVSSAAAATAGWERLDPPSTQKETSSSAKVIPAFEMVMRARTNVYHLECFACQQCNHRFCVGDRFFLCDNKILCEYDYEERMVFANLAYNSSANLASQMKSGNNRSNNGP